MLAFADSAVDDRLKPGDRIRIERFADALKSGGEIEASIERDCGTIKLGNALSPRQIEQIQARGLIDRMREGRARQTGPRTCGGREPDRLCAGVVP